MILQKWNPEIHEYEPFESPAVRLVIYSGDMDMLCDCANCGKEIVFGSSYTSRKIHTEFGFGYPVCTECYQEEFISLSK